MIPQEMQLITGQDVADQVIVLDPFAGHLIRLEPGLDPVAQLSEEAGTTREAFG